jgi:hypothetical protein
VNFLLPRHLIAFLFIAIPILLHLLRKSSVKQLQISSLYLFQRKEKKIFRHLKISYLLLLLSRIAIVAALACFFLQPVFENSPSFLQKIFPYNGKTIVFLDTAFDTKENLIQFFARNNPDLQITYKVIDPEDNLMNKIEARIEELDNETRSYLISRFYGFTQAELNRLQKLKIQPIPFGPETLEKIQLSNLRAKPETAFTGEKIHISGQLSSSLREKRKISVRLRAGNSHFNELIIDTEPGKKSGFSFELPATEPGKNEGFIEVENEKYKFEFMVRKDLRIAFIDDENISTQANSRLFYLRNFFQGLAELFNSGTVFILRDFKSPEFLNNQDKWDWVIFATISTPIEKLQRKGKEKFLVFRQKNEKSQLFWNNWFKMHHFIYEQKTRDVQFFKSPETSANALFQNWQIFRSLQIKPPPNADIYLSANADVLCFTYNTDIFSAFDWTKEEFSAVLNPSFPIFLTEIFLNRTLLPENISNDSKNFKRNTELFSRTGQNKAQMTADFSPFFLWLVFGFLCAELLLILKIEKITE